MSEPVDVSLLSRILDLSGAGLSALLGGLAAREERLDPIGFATIAIAAGLGGGIVRDTLMQRGTPIALTDWAFLVAAIVGAAIAFLLPRGGRRWAAISPWLDALVLGLWAAAGSDRALAHGLGWLPAILLGTMTGVGGGVVRDLLLARMPAIFRGGTLYATSALASTTTLVGLNSLGLPNIALLAATTVGTGLTLLARRRGWSLPDSTQAAAHMPEPLLEAVGADVEGIHEDLERDRRTAQRKAEREAKEARAHRYEQGAPDGRAPASASETAPIADPPREARSGPEQGRPPSAGEEPSGR